MKKGHLSFSLLFWLNKSRRKNDKPAIYLRLSIWNKRIELSTYQYVSPEQWNQAGQSVKGNSEEAQAVNRQLATLKGELHKHYALFACLPSDSIIGKLFFCNSYLFLRFN